MLKRHLLISTLLTLSGCISIDPKLGLNEINDTVLNRSGALIYRNDGSEEDKIINSKIDSLLSQELTLETATQIALYRNRNLQATFQELGIAQADLVSSGLLDNPFVDGEIVFPKTGVSFDLAIVQNFVGIFEIPLRKKIAESEFEEAKLKVIKEALTLAHRTRTAFYKHQALQQIIDNDKKFLQVIEASKELAQSLHKAGNINDLRLTQEHAKYETLKLSIADNEYKLIETKEMLNVLMGVNSEQKLWKISSNLPHPETNNLQLKEIETKALANSLDLAEIRQKISTKITALGYEKDFAMFQDSELGVKGVKESEGKWEFGPKFKIPLPFFNTGEARIFRANSELSQLYDYFALAEVKLRSRIRSAVGRLKIAESKIETYNKNLIPLYDKLVSESQKHFNAMLIGSFDLLEAKQNQININKDFILALEHYWILKTEVESLINGIMPPSENLVQD